MIRVVLSKPKSWFSPISWAIRWATSFGASHSSIHFIERIPDTFLSGDCMVTEAVGKAGVSMAHVSRWSSHNVHVHVRVLKEEYYFQGVQAFSKIRKHLGDSYDFAGIWYFAWRLILKRLFGIRTYSPDTENKMFCSELVARWLIELRRIINIPGIDAIPPDETSPADLLPMMDEMGIFEDIDFQEYS